VVPLRSEYKPPTVLLSRKGPVTQTQNPRPPTAGLENLSLKNGTTISNAAQESSEDEDEVKARELTLAERQAQAAKDREEKQRKYEERRKELFGNSSSSLTAPQQGNQHRSGNTTPSSLTPPGSRSATPNRGRGGRGGRRGGGDHSANSRNQSKNSPQLYDPTYGPKPDSTYVQRRENGSLTPVTPVQQPIRAPKGPDGSGRGGFGFTRILNTSQQSGSIPESTSSSGFPASASAS
jgi:hypothetical protein